MLHDCETYRSTPHAYTAEVGRCTCTGVDGLMLNSITPPFVVIVGPAQLAGPSGATGFGFHSEAGAVAPTTIRWSTFVLLLSKRVWTESYMQSAVNINFRCCRAIFKRIRWQPRAINVRSNVAKLLDVCTLTYMGSTFLKITAGAPRCSSQVPATEINAA